MHLDATRRSKQQLWRWNWKVNANLRDGSILISILKKS
jgi:hypothetical protein